MVVQDVDFDDSLLVKTHSTVIAPYTIKGGTFKIPSECKPEEIFSGIYGAGAGGMNGIGDDTNHTTDSRIPYWKDSSTKSVMAFGDYNAAKANLCMYNCYNADTHTYTEVDPRLTHNKIIIEGGIFGSKTRKIDGIYAGGSGYMSKDLWKKNLFQVKRVETYTEKQAKLQPLLSSMAANSIAVKVSSLVDVELIITMLPMHTMVILTIIKSLVRYMATLN